MDLFDIQSEIAVAEDRSRAFRDALESLPDVEDRLALTEWYHLFELETAREEVLGLDDTFPDDGITSAEDIAAGKRIIEQVEATRRSLEERPRRSAL